MEVQLSKLNDNMERVLDKLLDHEARLSRLETKNIKDEVQKQTLTEMAKFGWLAAKIIISVGAVICAVGGCSWALKLFEVL